MAQIDDDIARCMADSRRAAREQVRWYILVALDAGRPLGASERILLRALGDAEYRLTPGELRKELDYLEARKLVELRGNTELGDVWHAKLTRLGMDVVEYTVDCRPGIDRPPRRL